MLTPNIETMVETIASSIYENEGSYQVDDCIFTDMNGIEGNDWRVVYSYDYSPGDLTTEDDYYNGTGYSYYTNPHVGVEVNLVEYYSDKDEDWHEWGGNYRSIEREIRKSVLELCE